MSKKKEEINFDNLDYDEFIKARNIYMQKLIKEEAEESWKRKGENMEYIKQGVSYATLSDFNHT